MAKGSGGLKATNSRSAHGNEGGSTIKSVTSSIDSIANQIAGIQDARNAEIAKIEARYKLIEGGRAGGLEPKMRMAYEDAIAKIKNKYSSQLSALREKQHKFEMTLYNLSKK